MKIVTVFYLVFLSCCITSCAQTKSIIPPDFVEAVPPKVSSSEWYELNRSTNEFGVAIVDRNLIVKKVKEIHKSELKIKGGTLIGEDNGEWGGKIFFKPNDRKKAIVEIKTGNIKFIFGFQGKIYFIEGLAHLSINEGALFELVADKKGFSTNKLIDFEDAPETFSIYKDQFLIAASESFYLVQNFKKKLVIKDAFWDALYPNSIAVLNDENVFIGMRGGIGKLNLVTNEVKFYKYSLK